MSSKYTAISNFAHITNGQTFKWHVTFLGVYVHHFSLQTTDVEL